MSGPPPRPPATARIGSSRASAASLPVLRQGSAVEDPPMSLPGSARTARRRAPGSASFSVRGSEHQLITLEGFASSTQPARSISKLSLAAGGTTPEHPRGVTVESWPAPSHSVSWSPEGSAHSSVAARPPLLKTLESYLSRELSLLTPVDVASGCRVGIYREALRLFADHFRCYGPIISAAIAEFDTEIQRHKVVAERAEKMETTIRLSEHESAHRLQELESIKNLENQQLASSKAALEQMVAELQSACTESEEAFKSASAQTAELQDQKAKDLSKMLALIRAVKESDVRIRAITLKNQMLSRDLEKMEELKEMLIAAQSQLAALQAEQSDTVPRKTHNKVKADLLARWQKADQEERKMRRMCAARGAQNDKLTKVIAQLMQERELIKRDEPTTPRPDWDALRPEVESSIGVDMTDDRVTTIGWTEFLVARLKQEKQERERLEAEVHRLQDALADKSTASLIPSRNASCILSVLPAANPPLYLQAVGYVDRVESSRRDTVSNLHTMWEFRKHQRVSQSDMHASISQFFSQRFGKRMHEKAYNLFDACRRYRYIDARCDLTLSILEEGSMPERLQLDVSAFRDTIRSAILDLAATDKRRVRKSAVMEAVGPFLSHKSGAALDALKGALGREAMLDVDELTHPAHAFMDLITLQATEEGIDLYTKLVVSLTQLPPQANGMIACDDIELCIERIEPETPATEVELLIRDATEITVQPAGGTIRVLPLPVVIQRLGEVAIVRRSAPEQ